MQVFDIYLILQFNREAFMIAKAAQYYGDQNQVYYESLRRKWIKAIPVIVRNGLVHKIHENLPPPELHCIPKVYVSVFGIYEPHGYNRTCSLMTLLLLQISMTSVLLSSKLLMPWIRANSTLPSA